MYIEEEYLNDEQQMGYKIIESIKTRNPKYISTSNQMKLFHTHIAWIQNCLTVKIILDYRRPTNLNVCKISNKANLNLGKELNLTIGIISLLAFTISQNFS